MLVSWLKFLLCTLYTQGRPVCEDPGLKWNAMTEAVLKSTANSEGLLPAMVLYRDEGYTVGSITDMLAEAADASATDAPVENGKSGDTDFPFANVKVLATMGERNACNGPYKGNKLNGVPDGVGAYLYDDATIRLVYQSESYGPLRYDTAPYPVNDGAAKFGGSYVHYIDYDRSLMADFMTNKDPASSMVTHVGTLIETVYNLKGELVGPRNGTSPTPVGAHYGNTDADGLWTVAKTPTLDYDWFYQSFCSAHLEPPFQWGPGTGMRDHIFLTNEEWMNYLPGSNYVGLGVSHVCLLRLGAIFSLSNILHLFRLMLWISRRRPCGRWVFLDREALKSLSNLTLNTMILSLLHPPVCSF